MNELISIIVPVYNVEKYLDHCINSVLNQSYTNWELILVDDGSPDGSPEICDRYALHNQKIKVIHKENGGLSSARNAGIDIATGDYITFLDSDDYLHSDYLKIMLSYAIEKNADIVQCDFSRVKSDIPNSSKNNSITYQIYDNHSIFLKGAAKIILCAKLYKKDLWGVVRMPIGKINEDDFTTWKLYYNSHKILVLSEKLYFYRVNPKSIMASQKKYIRLDFLQAYEERIQFFRSLQENDLEMVSRLQLTKSLFLKCCNSNISEETYSLLRERFCINWELLKSSSVVDYKYRALFYFFYRVPCLVLFFVKFIR